MSKFSRSTSRGKVPSLHAHERQYGKATKQTLVCSDCHCYFFKKSWHHPETVNGFRMRSEQAGSKQVTCPACLMVRERQYAGRILIERVPEKMATELVNLITSYARKSYMRDPQERVVSVKHSQNNVEVTTTENQLAVRLAKKIQDVFTKVTLAISYSEEPSLTGFARLRFV